MVSWVVAFLAVHYTDIFVYNAMHRHVLVARQSRWYDARLGQHSV
ncbi:hypothetical protein [Phytohalomonas tamaricis]|nr:hypothetical protein [Phytohalomonas tamaricis]